VRMPEDRSGSWCTTAPTLLITMTGPGQVRQAVSLLAVVELAGGANSLLTLSVMPALARSSQRFARSFSSRAMRNLLYFSLGRLNGRAVGAITGSACFTGPKASRASTRSNNSRIA
jgi:hypothetical protein